MLDNYNDDIHFKRYLKYKSKYLELKQSGGGFFSSDPYTVATEKSITNRNGKEIKSLDYEEYRQYNNNIIKNLISNFKKDNKLDKLDQSTDDSEGKDKLAKIENLSTGYNFFTKISSVENSEKVNFTTNFNEIDRLMTDKQNYNNTFINKLEIFKNELNNYIIMGSNLFKLQYQVELNSILRQYIVFLITFIKMQIPKHYPVQVWDDSRGVNRNTRPGQVRKGPNAFFPT
jgi:hypothetical protein